MNADDFGLTPGVNRAIVELHAAGVLTSTSLMARAGATDEAIEIARCHPHAWRRLPRGSGRWRAHCSRRSRFPPLSIREPACSTPRSQHFCRGLFTGRIRSAEIEAETRAQIEFLQNKGLHLTHIDTHKHTHMFPSVLRPVLRAARACGIRAVRNPFEPAWALRTAIGAPWLRLAQVSALRWLEPVCRRIIAEEGFTTTDGTVAVAGTGTLDTATLRCLLRQMPAGTWELVTHPGYNDADLARVRTRLRASRDVERQALAAVKEFPAIGLVSFGDLRSPPIP